MEPTLIERAWNEKYAFFGVFFVIFFMSYLALVAIDFVPEDPAPTPDSLEMKDTTVVETPAKAENLPVGTFKDPASP
jgi:hypothetical protein